MWEFPSLLFRNEFGREKVGVKGRKGRGTRDDPKAPALRPSLLFTENPVNIGLQRETRNPDSALR